MQHLEGSGTPVLYIGRTVLKGQNTQYLYLLKKLYKMQHLEGSGTPVLYEGYSNENLKSAIKIRNTAQLSCKLTTMLLMG